ncbi:hypothetical protein N8967_05020 [Akkermansiaceae bacterium]|nr:hypothetical protein [Akkermansiaceae bacterium]
MTLENLTGTLLNNSTQSIFFKVINILVTLLLIRVTLGLLTTEQYAFWIVFLSVLAWVNMLDFGVGQGFRNLYTDARLLNKISDARALISTLYFLNIIFVSFVATLFFIFVIRLSIFGASDLLQPKWVFFLFCVFLLKYVFRSLTYLLLASHRARFNMLLILLENALALCWVLICRQLGDLEFKDFIFGYLATQLITVIIFSYFIFKNTELELPNLKDINLVSSKKIAENGLKYFILQLIAFLLFGSLPYLISLHFTSIQVVEFGVTWRFFSALVSLVMISVGPLWSLFKVAKTTNNVSWMKDIWCKSFSLILIFSVIMCLSLSYVSDFMKIWLGKDLNLETSYFIPFSIYVCVMAWTGLHSQILNGFGILKISITASIFQIATYFLLIYYWIGSFDSPHFVIYALLVSFVFPVFMLPISSFKLINKKK